MLYSTQGMNNHQIAKLFKHVAASYRIKDEKKYRFQIIAYEKAADSIDNLTTQLKDLVAENALDHIPGIGASMKASIEELFQTGHVKHLEAIMKDIPPSVFPLLDIPSFGPKKAYKIVTAFKLKDEKKVIDNVEALAKTGRIAELQGFGEKSEADILRAIAEFKKGTDKVTRMVLPYAFDISNKIVTYLKTHKHVKKAYPLGSLRRMVSTIGDVDIAVTSDNSEAVIEHFVSYPYKERIIEKGDVTASILVAGGKHVDLLVLPPEYFGSMLQHFTGSKHHNVELREYALKKGYSLSERGIKTKKDNKLHTFSEEEDFYEFLGLDWIPPEIRENTGEIEHALNHTLPNLVEVSDMKGDLHIHSNYPLEPSHDLGADTMETMIKKAQELKYEYLGFSEHNPSVTHHTKEQIYSILSKRKDKIEQLIESNKNIRIINLLETDILASGELALDNKAFEYVDAVLVSIHSSFGMEKKKMTERIIHGLSHPKAKILSHPTGRLLNQREGYDVDWEELYDFVIKNNKALEINAWPSRLDLPDNLVKKAKEAGVKFVIDTDSHAVDHMNNMFYGVSVAKRGWCTKEDIWNAQSASRFCNWIKA